MYPPKSGKNEKNLKLEKKRFRFGKKISALISKLDLGFGRTLCEMYLDATSRFRKGCTISIQKIDILFYPTKQKRNLKKKEERKNLEKKGQ